MDDGKYELERLASVGALLDQAKHWLKAGDPECSAGPSWWSRQEEALTEAIAKGYRAETTEERCLHEAFQQFKQQMWLRAGELLQKAAKDRVADARELAARLQAQADEADRL